MTVRKGSAGFKEGNFESNCFQSLSVRLGWNPTESTSITRKIRTKINKEDLEKPVDEREKPSTAKEEPWAVK